MAFSSTSHSALWSVPVPSSQRAARRRSVLAACSGSLFWEGMAVPELKSEGQSFLSQCEDLDWKREADQLRREAQSPSTRCAREAAGRTPEKENEGEWDYTDAVLRLRRQASSQVAQDLLKKLNPPDLESAVLRLTNHILSRAFTQLDEGGKDISKPSTLPKLAMVVVPVLGVHTALIESALADPEVQQQASKVAPSWLAPAVLSFPVVSYLLFSLYRDKVDPQAKLTDWMFGVGAAFILGNLVTIATLGVRLY